jgi:hypothetical protein
MHLVMQNGPKMMRTLGLLPVMPSNMVLSCLG